MLGVKGEDGGCSVPPTQSRDRGLIVPVPAEGSPSFDGSRAQDEDVPTRLAGSTSEETEPGDELCLRSTHRGTLT